jgi:hypothetical protein
MLAAACFSLLIPGLCHAVDLTPYLAALSPIYYQGQQYTIDVGASTSSDIVFDVDNDVSNPPVDGSPVAYFELQDLGWGVRFAGYVPAINGSLYYGSDPSGLVLTLSQEGFTVGEQDSSGGSGSVSVTSGTVNLDSADAGNVQGVYQVALWIFGAVLMLPIILKVRPH